MANKSSRKSDTLNALDLLTEDHERVKQLFAEFEQMQGDEEDAENKRYLVELACAELSIHAQLEEELFYPALRDALEEQDMLDEAQVEHDTAKQLIAELDTMQPDEDLYDAKFKVLSEYVKHHIDEEENEIFAQAEKSGIDLDALAVAMLERQDELRAEYGLIEEDEEDAAFMQQQQDNQPDRPQA